MGGYGLRSGYTMLFWIGIACVNAYIAYIYWKRPKRRSIYKDFKKSFTTTNKIPKRILLVGLKGSGKTSLVNQIFFANEIDMNRTTLRKPPKSFLTVLENVSYLYNIYEIANFAMPESYECMFYYIELIIFVIDSSDIDKLPLAATLFEKLLANPRIKETPILIVANKQDHFHALSPEQVKEALNLPNMLVSRHKIEVIGCQTKPLPELPKGAYESQYHSSVIAVKNKIFSMTA